MFRDKHTGSSGWESASSAAGHEPRSAAVAGKPPVFTSSTSGKEGAASGDQPSSTVHSRTEPPDMQRQETEYKLFRRDLKGSAERLAKRLLTFEEINSINEWSESRITGILINALKERGVDALVSYVSMTLVVLDDVIARADEMKSHHELKTDKYLYTALIAKFVACKNAMARVPADELSIVKEFVKTKQFREIWQTILAGEDALAVSPPEKAAKLLGELLPKESRDEFLGFFKPKAVPMPPEQSATYTPSPSGKKVQTTGSPEFS